MSSKFPKINQNFGRGVEVQLFVFCLSLKLVSGAERFCYHYRNLSNSEIDRSKSIGRIYLNTFYMFLVVVTAYAIVRYSKKRQAEGYSIEGENRKRNEKWQKERLEREAKAKEEGA